MPPPIDTRDAALFAVFRDQRKIRPSEWAERYRVLTSEQTALPGRWSNRVAPYLTAIMDAVISPSVREVVVLKAAQVGYSEAMRNVLGWAADCDPGPALVVAPIDRARDELFRERIIPLFRTTPKLRELLTGRADDVRLDGLSLKTMHIYGGAATSPDDLASRPIRWLFLDEVNRFQTISEGDPIHLARKRTASFGSRARVVLGSTPTDESGVVWREWITCDARLAFFLPCPSCGKFSSPSWSHVRWLAEEGRVREAWLECPHCLSRIEESRKSELLLLGKWAPENSVVTEDFRYSPTGSRIGFHVHGLLSPFVQWREIAQRYVSARTEENREALRVWTNADLGEVFRDEVGNSLTSSTIAKLPRIGKPGVVPSWARTVFATADTQTHGFYWLVRAHGAGRKSHLLAYGRAENFQQLRRVALDSVWLDERGKKFQVEYLAIDSGGSRTDEVYDFCAEDPERIIAVKGEREVPANAGANWRRGNVRPRSHAVGPQIQFYLLNVNRYKDELARLIAGVASDSPLETFWSVHAEVDHEYAQHLLGETRVQDPKTRREFWRKRHARARVDYWDCEVYQRFLADFAGLRYLEDEKPQPPPRPEHLRRDSRDFGFGRFRW